MIFKIKYPRNFLIEDQNGGYITKNHCLAMAIVIGIFFMWFKTPKWIFYSSNINIWYIY